MRPHDARNGRSSRRLLVALLALGLAVWGQAVPARAGSADDSARYERLRYVADTLVQLEGASEHGAPAPEDSVGIGPGSTLLVNFFDPRENANFIGICTAAFIFRDVNTGKVYLGAAGHCFMGETFASTHGPDADWDPANTRRVRVCVQTCIGGGTGLLSAARGVYPGTTRDLGALSYARQRTGSAQVGHDFGIVEVPSGLHGEIRTDMPMWHGPATSDTSRQVQAGDVMVHYGNGVGVGEVPPQKGRAGVGVTSNAQSWRANAAAAPGDSGSAVNIAAVGSDGVVEGHWAAGILTHLSIGTSGGVVAGTNTSRAVQMAQEAGFQLEVVHDPSQLDPGEPDPSEPLAAVIGGPSRARAGEAVTFDGSASGGDIAFWHWDLGDGTVIEGSDASVIEHTYTSPGRRTVTLTISDADGGTDTATHRIQIKGPPAKG
ncbi:MAG TPA: PKD domain-containing protein [Actinomycetota bacterium]|nr:PKD domain-containing protein [Actinomycetota bacterium]